MIGLFLCGKCRMMSKKPFSAAEITAIASRMAALIVPTKIIY